MSSKLYRYLAPVAVGATVVAGAGVLGVGAASAATTTTPFNNACQATPSSKSGRWAADPGAGGVGDGRCARNRGAR